MVQFSLAVIFIFGIYGNAEFRKKWRSFLSLNHHRVPRIDR
jgi:hypothetical protein